MLPKISIITPSFIQPGSIHRGHNSERFGPKTYPHLEYLIIDGDSSDGTLNILSRYSRSLKWISEPDKGQAHAINRGFKKSTGEIIAWLNSDDIYLSDTLHSVAEFFSQHPDIDVVYGDYHLIGEQRSVLLCKQEIPFDFYADERVLHSWNKEWGKSLFLKQRSEKIVPLASAPQNIIRFFPELAAEIQQLVPNM